MRVRHSTGHRPCFVSHIRNSVCTLEHVLHSFMCGMAYGVRADEKWTANKMNCPRNSNSWIFRKRPTRCKRFGEVPPAPPLLPIFIILHGTTACMLGSSPSLSRVRPAACCSTGCLLFDRSVSDRLLFSAQSRRCHSPITPPRAIESCTVYLRPTRTLAISWTSWHLLLALGYYMSSPRLAWRGPFLYKTSMHSSINFT